MVAAMKTTPNCLTLAQRIGYIAGAAFNHVAEIGVSNIQADKPLPSGIFTSVNTTDASFMAGRGGGSFGCVGFLYADTPTLLHQTRHPQLALSGGLLKPIQEAFTMPAPARTLFAYLTLAVTVIAIERQTSLIVVALSFATFCLVHVIGGKRNHA